MDNNDSIDSSFLGRVFSSGWFFLGSFVFFVAVLASMFLKKDIVTFSSEPESTVVQKTSYTVSRKASYERSQKINELTRQLMASKNAKEESLVNSTIKEASIENDNYIATLNQINKKTTSVDSQDKSLAEIDYYNRVTINNSKNDSNSFQNKINNFMLNSQEKDKGYAKDLNKESVVRINEVRSIKLKKGESIWLLAKRAYGDGLLYHKIMEANPHITEENARMLAPGTIIRVPI